MPILLVDDEIELTDPLRRILSKEGYEVDVANDGISGSNLACKQNYDLIILDWLMPQLSGLHICQQLRSQGKTTPVLFLTAKDTIDDRVLGLDAGADDYLIKPFELRELLARVRALLRRSVHFEPQDQNQLIKVADLELDEKNQLAYRQGRVIELSQKEVKLLSYFMGHHSQLLSHSDIYQHLWSEEEKPNSNVLAALVRLLRRKIEHQGEDPLINTVYGKGYRFGN